MYVPSIELDDAQITPGHSTTAQHYLSPKTKKKSELI